MGIMKVTYDHNTYWSREFKSMMEILSKEGITFNEDGVCQFDELPWIKNPELFKKHGHSDNAALYMYSDLDAITFCTWASYNDEMALNHAIDKFVTHRDFSCLFPNVICITSAADLSYQLKRLKALTTSLEDIIMSPKMIALFKELDDKGIETDIELRDKIKTYVRERLLISGD